MAKYRSKNIRKSIREGPEEKRGSIVTNKSIEKSAGRGADSVDIDPTKLIPLTYTQRNSLFDTVELVQRIISIPVLDSVKDGLEITFKKEADKSRFDKYCKDNKIDIIKIATRIAMFARKHGTACLYGVFDEVGGTNSLGEELGTVTGIKKFNVSDNSQITELKYNDDFLSENFGKIEKIKVKKKNKGNIEIDKSRIFLLHNRGGKDSKGFGISQIQKLNMELTMTHTIKWSLAEIAYRLNFLYITTDKNTAEKDLEQENFLRDINTKTQAFGKKGYEVKGVNSGAGINPVNWYQFVMEVISSSTGIPKQRLIGQQKGVLAAGQEDREQYFELLEVTRNRDLNPSINWMVEKIAETINLGEYEIEWGDLTRTSEKDALDIQTSKAELLNKLIDGFTKLAGVKGQDIARAAVFEIAEGMDFDEDMMAELAKITGK